MKQPQFIPRKNYSDINKPLVRTVILKFFGFFKEERATPPHFCIEIWEHLIIKYQIYSRQHQRNITLFHQDE